MIEKARISDSDDIEKLWKGVSKKELSRYIGVKIVGEFIDSGELAA